MHQSRLGVLPLSYQICHYLLCQIRRIQGFQTLLLVLVQPGYKTFLNAAFTSLYFLLWYRNDASDISLTGLCIWNSMGLTSSVLLSRSRSISSLVDGSVRAGGSTKSGSLSTMFTSKSSMSPLSLQRVFSDVGYIAYHLLETDQGKHP